MSANWNNLRPWRNSQNSAFEQLCCQLAEYETHPEGAKFVRKGTPDGGIECFWILPTGSEWGWQAKFLFPPFGAAQWNQLDESVYSALENHRSLIRYTICLPFDRPDPRSPKGNKTFLDRWNEQVNKWQARAAALGRTVDFVYWGESELTNRLSKEEHAGRYKFWFDKEFLSNHWFSNHIQEVTANAGDRYTPTLTVDLPIAAAFDALGRTPEFFNRVDLLHKEIRKELRLLTSGRINDIIPDHAQQLWRETDALLRTLAEMRSNSWGELPFNDLAKREIESANECIRLLKEQIDVHPSQADANAASQSGPTLKELIGRMERLVRSLYDLREFSTSTSAAVANTPSLLLVGEAGSGKTHLLCDVADRRIKEGQPTLILLGQQFGEAEPWKQILDLLKLNCTREELLGALDAAAQAAGTRALIFIDALNEGDGEKIWIKHLAGMLAHLENYSRIGVAFSVRTSYETVIIPRQIVANHKIVRIEHRGFEEREYEAATRFFAHFGLEPSVPLLYPEFKNPQFLRLFCKGLKNKGISRVPPGLHGITSIFEFYLDSVNEKLAHAEYLGFDPSDRIVHRATEEITKLMAEKGVRFVAREEGKGIIDALLPDREYERSLFRHLIAESIFAEDLMYSGNEENTQRVLRFSYERFADHRIVKHLLDAHFDTKRPKRSFMAGPLQSFFQDGAKYWLHQGLIEAFSIQIPELTDKELHQLLPRSSADLPPIRRAFVESLLWRSRPGFRKPTFEYINRQVLRYRDSYERFWDVVLTLSPVPGHRLNADFLHTHLMRFSMADRDAWWSKFVHYQYRNTSAIVCSIGLGRRRKTKVWN